MSRPRLAFLAAFVLTAGPASAHVGVGDVRGFSHGFLHPLGGPDHVLAMVTVGLFAVMLGGRALWAVPASFVLMMLLGGALGMTGVEIPAVEAGIAASLIVLGAVVAVGWAWPLVAAVALVGVFAIFHGHAHGAEMPAAAGALAYAAGFALATALLHSVGLALGLSLRGRRDLMRLGGAATAAIGVALALGTIG